MNISGTWYADADVDDLPMFSHECDLPEVAVHWDSARGWHLVAADSERVRVPIRACPGCGVLLNEAPDEGKPARSAHHPTRRRQRTARAN